MKKFTRTVSLLLVLICFLPMQARAADTLIPGGQLLGLCLQEDAVTVARLDDSLLSGKTAGLLPGDRITHIDGQKINTAGDIRQALAHSDGTVDIQLVRSGKAQTLTATPDITPEGPRLGIYLKEGVTGVGTVTFYDPDTGRFAALGHSVNTPGGDLLPMTGGSVYKANLMCVKKGRSGTPGQLVGSLDAAAPLGQLEQNTVQGVFGTLTEPIPGTPMPIANADAVHTGPATIRSTVSDQGVQEYSVKILKIYPASRDQGRNMLLKITDPRLLETTGGIVQGMSGSPLVQDGKLIGAVTHVLVNDPTMGYGIFIENMLEAAG